LSFSLLPQSPLLISFTYLRDTSIALLEACRAQSTLAKRSRRTGSEPYA